MIMDSMKANKMFALPFAEIGGGGGGGKRDRDQHANGLIGNYFQKSLVLCKYICVRDLEKVFHEAKSLVPMEKFKHLSEAATTIMIKNSRKSNLCTAFGNT